VGTKTGRLNAPNIQPSGDDKGFNFPQLRKLPWKLLPNGEWNVNTVINHFRQRFASGRFSRQPVDENRLKKIVNWLNPSHCYIGENEFDGYVVFCFGDHETVILECPIYGNAIYLIRGDWQEITRLSKGKSLRRYPDKVKRVIHREDWIRHLQKAVNEWR